MIKICKHSIHLVDYQREVDKGKLTAVASFEKGVWSFVIGGIIATEDARMNYNIISVRWYRGEPRF